MSLDSDDDDCHRMDDDDDDDDTWLCMRNSELLLVAMSSSTREKCLRVVLTIERTKVLILINLNLMAIATMGLMEVDDGSLSSVHV